MLPALAMAGISAAGSLISGLGASQASAKQARLQQIENNMAREKNDATLLAVNNLRNRLGNELLQVEEAHDVSTENGSWVDVDGMMAAAERAGFNPVTFLNAGGMAAYTQGWSRQQTRSRGHNAAEAFKMMLPEYALAQPGQVPQQVSPLQGLGGALSAGANAFGTQFRADQAYDLGMAKIMAASAMQGMGLSNGNGFATATSGGSGGFAGAAAAVAGLSGSDRSAGGGKKDDAVWPGYEVAPSPIWDGKKPEVTNPFPPSWGWSIPPGYADAQAYEDAGTEIWSYPYSILKGVNTVLWNTTGNTLEGHGGRILSNTERDIATLINAARGGSSYNNTRYSGTPWSNGSMSP